MLLFLLLRRLSPRARTIVGVLVMAAGLAIAAVSEALSVGLLAHGIALFVIGAVVCANAVVNRRRAHLADRPGDVKELASAGRPDGR